VLESDDLPPRFFAGKVVFVGQAPGAKVDEYRTPYTRWSGFICADVELHATPFLNLVRRDWLSRLPFPAELGLIISLGFILGFGLTWLRPVPAAAVALAGCLCVPVLASALVWQTHLWFAWAIVPAVQIPVALGCAILSRLSPASQRGDVLTQPELAPDVKPPIPDHTLLRRIGEGSYGEVWLARNVMGTYQAVKVVYRKQFDSDGPFAREFSGIRNFEPISRSHEGFVDILQVGRNEPLGFFYYVMEVADDTLLGPQINPDTYEPKTLSKELARKGRLPASECLQLGLCLADALHRLHKKGLVHRNIKPSNIVYVDGVPKLADIGLVAELG
jgi:hypothetical protein